MQQAKKRVTEHPFRLRISPEELERQLNEYSTLKITDSYRGISVVIVLILMGVSFLFSFSEGIFGVLEVLVMAIIYAPFLYFTYVGKRWAIIALMLLWTVHRWFLFYMTGMSLIPLIWWVVLLPYFYMALQVENARLKKLDAKNV